jgi:hypothetical protein
MFTDLQKTGNEQFEKQENENRWKGSYFESFNKLCADYSGKAGENAMYSFLVRTKNNGLHKWEIEYDGDSNINQSDGTYDIAITSHKRFMLGQKTARIGKQNSFQHENLHNNVCDGEIFLDISPNYAHLTIILFDSYSLSEKHPTFNVKPHLRKNTNNNFKMNLSEKNLNEGVKHRLTIKIDENTQDIEVIKFISQFID